MDPETVVDTVELGLLPAGYAETYQLPSPIEYTAFRGRRFDYGWSTSNGTGWTLYLEVDRQQEPHAAMVLPKNSRDEAQREARMAYQREIDRNGRPGPS